ncbi:MAG TPA: pirin family protein [Sporichthya sp.]|nr:pirin family protein [Sporichthya sp.]
MSGSFVLRQREVPLGGPRAMTVRRSLPQRERSLIGAWCFFDHYGPDDVSVSGGMALPGHPHTGLQTVSWLFAGEIEHRDTSGAHAFVRAGELNIMTAGSGIAHSEYSTPQTGVLRGAQLWVALPAAHRSMERQFEHYVASEFEVDGGRVRVFLGSLFGQSSPVRTWSALTGAEVVLPAASTLDIPVPRDHEHGLLCDSGTVTADGRTAGQGEVVVLPAGPSVLRVTAGPEQTRFLVLGGEPLGEQIVMWWNFIGGSHDEILAFREDWQSQRALPDNGGRFGAFPAAWSSTLPAPVLPNVRLRPRG